MKNRITKEYEIPTEKKHYVEEQVVSYNYIESAESCNSFKEIRNKIYNGVAYPFLDTLQMQLKFTEDKWADILSLSTKSLQRYKKDKDFRFKPIHSEKLIEIAEVVALGKAIFGNTEKFNKWLSIPNFALGNLKPEDLITDSYGKQQVIEELQRIEHGIFV